MIMAFAGLMLQFLLFFYYLNQMKSNQTKPGMTTKPTPGAKVTPGSTGTSNKGPDPKHLPREFK